MKKYIILVGCLFSIMTTFNYTMAASNCSATVNWQKTWTSTTCPTIDQAYNDLNYCKSETWTGKPNYIRCSGGKMYWSCTSTKWVMNGNMCWVTVSEISKNFITWDTIDLDTLELVWVSWRSLTNSCTATIMWQKTWTWSCPSLTEAYNTHWFCKNNTDSKNLDAKLNYVNCSNWKITWSCTFGNAISKDSKCWVVLPWSSTFYTDWNSVNLDNMSIYWNSVTAQGDSCSANIHWQKDWTGSCPTIDEAYNTHSFCKSTNNAWSWKPNYIECSNGKIYWSCTFANKWTIVNNKCSFMLPWTGKTYTDWQTIDLTTWRLVTSSTRTDGSNSCYVTVNWTNSWTQSSCPTPEQAYNGWLCKTSEWIGKPGYIKCKSGNISGSCTSNKWTMVNGKCSLTIPWMWTYTDWQNVSISSIRQSSSSPTSINWSIRTQNTTNLMDWTQNMTIEQEITLLNSMILTLKTNNTSDQNVIATLERMSNILKRLSSTSGNSSTINSWNTNGTSNDQNTSSWQEVTVNLTNIWENKVTLNFTKAQWLSRYTFHLINTDTNKLTLGWWWDASCNNSNSSTCSFTIWWGSSSDKYWSYNLTPWTNYQIEVHAATSFEDTNYKIVKKTFKTLWNTPTQTSITIGTSTTTVTPGTNGASNQVEEMAVTNIWEKWFTVEFNKVSWATTHSVIVYDNTNKQSILSWGYDANGCDNSTVTRCSFKVWVWWKYNDSITPWTEYIVIVKAYWNQQALKEYTKTIKTTGALSATSNPVSNTVITSSSDISISDIWQRSFTVNFNKTSWSTGNYVYVYDKTLNEYILRGWYDATCDQSSSNKCSFKVGVWWKYNDPVTPGTSYKVAVKSWDIYHTAEFATLR